MFDRYVVAQTKPSWGRRALIIASVVLHGAAAAGFIIWSFFHVEEIVPPSLSLTVFSAPPPPPPPPPPKAHHAQTEHTQPKPHVEITQPTNVQKIVQPKEEEKKPEPEDEPDEDGAEEGGEEGGVKGGVVGGVKGGVVGGVKGGQLGGNGTDMNAKPPSPAKLVPQFVLAASKVSVADPHLPEWFKQQHAQQTVTATYKIIVGQNGRVMDVIVLAGLPGLDQTIIDQIKSSWQFKPQQLPVFANWRFVFKIN